MRTPAAVGANVTVTVQLVAGARAAALVLNPPLVRGQDQRAFGGYWWADVIRKTLGFFATVSSSETLTGPLCCRMADWEVGGDNIKIGDPQFFPDSLTIEVSATAASPEDHSREEAQNLLAALKKQGVTATLRFTTLAFPPNFMRIKIAGQ